MSEQHPIIKKLQLKDESQPILILNAPKEYGEVIEAFEADVHKEIKLASYPFVQVFGASNKEIQTCAKQALACFEEGGLLWLCYPKKSSKKYKGSDCSRETVAALLSDEDYEPVRQVAIDDDWSALRFKPVDQIKKMTRKIAVTEKGKQRIEK
ncbi:DUF3052 domain-containing protein [Salipaludibacillus aurantiacus]|uniref:DUF3052 domain-containing protein n=1 Tax=Salipaludibacillus aurantiacus TaxID=1601833 RepID=A0A1H9W3G5_9BACI|nr:DUF3052 domain-containing protein [Salipaludibacillus aurantiacus]SES28435.1 hypothetical protein SAMN05518684_11443 [Salipaludibacillus aurantiacus]